MDGVREGRRVKAECPRRIGQEELLPRALVGEHGMDLQEGEFQCPGRIGGFGLDRGKECGRPSQDKPAQGDGDDPGIDAGSLAVAISVDHPVSRGAGIVSVPVRAWVGSFMIAKRAKGELRGDLYRHWERVDVCGGDCITSSRRAE